MIYLFGDYSHSFGNNYKAIQTLFSYCWLQHYGQRRKSKSKNRKGGGFIKKCSCFFGAFHGFDRDGRSVFSKSKANKLSIFRDCNREHGISSCKIKFRGLQKLIWFFSHDFSL